VRATPASGTFRPNPDLGNGNTNRAELSVRRRSGGFAVRRDVQAEVRGEVGGPGEQITYGRVAAAGAALVPFGGTRVLLRAEAGYAGADLPAHRAFVMGGRGTLPGDPFRAWGGTQAILMHAEWRIPVPAFTLGIGSLARVPTTLTVAPFIATGWTDRPPAGGPWPATGDPRVSVGVALEWLGLIRLDFGMGTRGGGAQVCFDLSRDFWPIL
jgi:outer membrane protein assembly factor BamA